MIFGVGSDRGHLEMTVRSPFSPFSTRWRYVTTMVPFLPCCITRV